MFNLFSFFLFFFFTFKYAKFYYKVFNLLSGPKLDASSIKAFIYISCYLENRVVFNCNVPPIVRILSICCLYLKGGII